MTVLIRAARPDDSALVFSLICELAEYEKLSHEVEANEQDIAAALFGASPRLFCDIAEWNGEAVGFTIWFLIYSTFRGRHGMYLEDLFVRPSFRGRGIGKGLMRRLAQRCVEDGYARFEWAVLDWNAPSIAFYKSIGAEIKNEWKICRLSGRELAGFAHEGSNA